MKKRAILSILSLLILSYFPGCKEEDEPIGKVNITLSASSDFRAANSDPDGSTTVIWGCLVISETSTACIYYYNGEAQLDGQMSAEAIAAGQAPAVLPLWIMGLNLRPCK